MIKNRLLIFGILIFTILTRFSIDTYAYSNNVSNNFNNYVQVKDNIITGESVRYKFFMPEAWKDKVNVYRQVGQTGDKYLEKISFYYSPNGNGNVVNKINEAWFLTITVYGRNQKPLTKGEKVALTDKGYTFTTSVTSQNNYKDATTRNNFNKIIENSKNEKFIQKYLTYSDTTNTSARSNIYYKNYNKTSKSYIDENGVIYIPLRDFSNAKGYDITWYQKAKVVKLSKRGVSDAIYHNADNGIYQTKMIDNRIYVTKNYLANKWNENIYVDKNNNVYIS